MKTGITKALDVRAKSLNQAKAIIDMMNACHKEEDIVLDFVR